MLDWSLFIAWVSYMRTKVLGSGVSSETTTESATK